MSSRFRDPGTTWLDLLNDDVLVRCPVCDRLAKVVVTPGEPRPGPFVAHRLICPACGHTRDWASDRITRHDDGRDPYFGLPLWLRRPCAGHLLWAYGERHLDLLDDFVRARLRERDRPPGTPSSMAERLPAWIQSAHHRGDILHAIEHLRRILP
ncbi:hypothetical protein [Nonomuraea sp. NPDC046570]|uniref:hypothetical protein n=1 Tax=Nonomuraea sp. NPDC046570 TaxID=3155255 RepID=UPI0033E90980